MRVYTCTSSIYTCTGVCIYVRLKEKYRPRQTAERKIIIIIIPIKDERVYYVLYTHGAPYYKLCTVYSVQ